MKKYWTIFKISWSRELEYRFNFLLWRFRNVIVLVVLYYLWKNLSAAGNFAGYSSKELVTYVLLANVLRAIIFAGQSRRTAEEINDGTFSTYLIKPVNHFWLVFWRELAQRALLTISAVFEVAVFSAIVGADFFWQKNIAVLGLFFLSLIFSVILFFFLSYLISLIAFWTREAIGPRFLFDWALETTSGSFFPLDILPKAIFEFLSFLPFFYIVYFPLRVYLGRGDISFIIKGIALQLTWALLAGALTFFVWKKGLKKFSGEGI